MMSRLIIYTGRRHTFLGFVIFCFFCTLYINGLSAQSVDWVRNFGGSRDDFAYAVCQAQDSGFVVVGSTSSSDFDVTGYHGGNCAAFQCDDFWIFKVSKNGSLEWAKTMGGTMRDMALCVITSGPNFIIGGTTFSSDGDVIGNHGGSDAWLIKMDGSGNLLWQKCIGSSGYEGFYSLLELSDKSLIACGGTTSNDSLVPGNHGSEDYWLVKMDSMGNVLWSQCYGGCCYENANKVKQTADQGFILSGTAESNDGQPQLPLDRGKDYWIVKTDSVGLFQWSRFYGGSLYERNSSCCVSDDFGFVITGRAISYDDDVLNRHDQSAGDGWTIKTDSSGSIEWQNAYGGTSWDQMNSVINTRDSGYALTGLAGSNDGDVIGNHDWDIWFLKIAANGIIESQLCVGGPFGEEGLDILQSYDRGYAIVGYTTGLGGDVPGFYGGYDVLVTKLNPIVNSLSEITNQELIFFPNPAQNDMWLMNLHKSQYANLYSQSGLKIKQFELKSTEEKLDISDLSPGVYYIKMEDGTVTKLLKY